MIPHGNGRAEYPGQIGTHRVEDQMIMRVRLVGHDVGNPSSDGYRGNPG